MIQPWNFNWHDEQGVKHEDNFQKRTLLWLRNLPPLIPDRTTKPEETLKWVNAGTKQADGSKLERIGLHNSSRERSKTFLGIAEAMAKQWSSYVIERKKASESSLDEVADTNHSTGQIDEGEDDVIPFIGECTL